MLSVNNYIKKVIRKYTEQVNNADNTICAF